jgi:hypothetical protein
MQDKLMYFIFKFSKHNIFLSIANNKGYTLVTKSLGHYGNNLKYFNIRYINNLLEINLIRKCLKSVKNILIKIKGRFRNSILLRIFNILKKIRLNIIGINFKALVSFNGCKLKS